MKNIRFIQFPHPGGEHRPGPDGSGKAWNRITLPDGSNISHARTFFQVNGTRLTGEGMVTGPLWAWGEWEAEANVLRAWEGADGGPTTLFEPFWVRKNGFENLHNTDPFVFGGFFYTDCKQGTSPSSQGMLELDVGSVIIFGSVSRGRWVLDTVFVVRDYIDHNSANYQERLHNRVPAGYDQLVLGPTYGPHSDRRHLPRRLYIGATFSEPLDGMFSFFPCSAPGDTQGFARPEIKLSTVLTNEYFNPNLAQGMKGQSKSAAALPLARVKALWDEVRGQVRASGCELGVCADMPQQQGMRATSQ